MSRKVYNGRISGATDKVGWACRENEQRSPTKEDVCAAVELMEKDTERKIGLETA